VSPPGPPGEAVTGPRPGAERPVRVGVIVPSSNTVLETELARLAELAGKVELHATRVGVTRIGLDPSASAQFAPAAMLDAAGLLVDAGVDVVVWGGTAGSWLGVDRDRHLAAEMAAASGVPATTATLALLDACRAFGVERVGMVTPYVGDVVGQIRERWGVEGVDVATEAHLGLSGNRSFADVDPEDLIGLVERLDRDRVQAIVVACTNLRGAPIVVRLEEVTGLVVLDSVEAAFWGAVRAGGRHLSLPAAGSLLRTGSLRSQSVEASDHLRRVTGSDRVTVRVDEPLLGLDVDLCLAESAAPGLARIGHDRSLDQRSLATVRWLEENRRTLVQADFAEEPRPPAALIDVYGVEAQMLGPLVIGGKVKGWISVHSTVARRWRPADVAALEATVVLVRELLTAGEPA
jgi:maleate isomerase